MQVGEVYRNQKLAGKITKNHDGYQFEYNADYLNDANALPIAISFPLREKPYTSSFLFPFFANMLAEGSTKTIQCRELHIDENDLFTRLLKTTESNTIGSVTVKDVTEYKGKFFNRLLMELTEGLGDKA